MPEPRQRKAHQDSRAFKVFICYSHSESKFVHDSAFKSFLEALEKGENVRVWSDRDIDRSDWDEQIQQELQAADMILCIVSQPFLNSRYIRKVELAIARRRTRMEGLAVVPLMYSRSMWKDQRFLAKLQHLPTDDTYIEERRNRNKLLFEIVTDIRDRIKKLRRGIPGAPGLFREPRSLYVLRRLPDSSFTAKEHVLLKRDSCRRAELAVPQLSKRLEICREGQRRLRKNGGRALAKDELRSIDKHVLAAKGRQPDAFRIRWVLRCADLHPQGSDKEGSWHRQRRSGLLTARLRRLGQ
jgi:hypothetical protein